MTHPIKISGSPVPMPETPSVAVSVLLFVASIGFMGLLRLYWFPQRFLALAYGLPLLLCLWHRDRRLIWSLALAFGAMSTYKAFVLRPDAHLSMDEAEWGMQLASIGVLAAAVHQIGLLTDRLRERNVDLAHTNALLGAREEEVSRQNEEIRQQSEELEQQAEELKFQAETLLSANRELEQRQRMLQVLLDSFRGPTADRQVLERICRSLLDLIGRQASAAAIVERSGADVALRAYAGAIAPGGDRWPFENSLSSLVIAKGRTAYVDDLSARADLVVLKPQSGAFRSVLATPLEQSGSPVGTIQVYAEDPRSWTKEEFRVIEWVAAQCSLVLESRRLKKELEEVNAGLERQVRERTAELRGMVDELEHFSYTITHDMRAPLRAMHGFARLIQERCAPGLDSDCKDYLGRIMTAAARMDCLITDALNYSRSGREEMPLESIDPLGLLRGIIESYPDLQIPRAKIELPEQLPAVVANAAGLTQCFSNLLGNAIKFVDAGKVPHVVVRTESREDRVRLWFEDDGIGIAPEMLPRIFGMFQRASKKYEGTGIGLALVRKVAERMGGNVGVQSEPGKGSQFWIELRRGT